MINRALILAGGIGSRMGKASEMLPKFFLPVNQEPLLHRLLCQIEQSQIEEVVISTNAANYPVITEFVKSYHATRRILVLNNKYHEKSVVSAFYALKDVLQWKNDPFILALSDIFYLHSPFNLINAFAGKEDVLFGSRCVDPLELSRGGIIVINKRSNIKDIIRKPTDIKDGARWSGLAICGQDFWDDFSKTDIKVDISRIALEDIFQFRICNGKIALYEDCGDFVNVNSPKHFILANLLILKCRMGVRDDDLLNVINKVKRSILNDGNQL